MSLVERTGIDDGNPPTPDDIGHRALEREWAGIVGEHPAHAGRDLLHGVGGEVEALVEGNVVAHADGSRPRRDGTPMPPVWIASLGSPIDRPRQPSLRPMMSSQRTSPDCSSPR